jgi:hypothetical protein
VDPVAQAADHQPIEAAENPELDGDWSPMENVPTGILEPSAATEDDAEVSPYCVVKGRFARTSGLTTVTRVLRARKGIARVSLSF